LYERYYLRHLLTQVRQRERLFPDQPPARFPRCLTMRLFDDLFTAPTWGFAGADDYYRRASALPVIGRIAVPSLILTARDDPLIAVGPFEELPQSPYLKVQILTRGGHVGFVGHDGNGGIRWAERRAAEWGMNGAVTDA